MPLSCNDHKVQNLGWGGQKQEENFVGSLFLVCLFVFNASVYSYSTYLLITILIS